MRIIALIAAVAALAFVTPALAEVAVGHLVFESVSPVVALDMDADCACDTFQEAAANEQDDPMTALGYRRSLWEPEPTLYNVGCPSGGEACPMPLVERTLRLQKLWDRLHISIAFVMARVYEYKHPSPISAGALGTP